MKLTSSALLALSISSLTAMANAEEFIATQLKSGASAQSETKGFVEEQTLGGTTRNWYANELKRRSDRFTYNDHGTRETTPRRINWVQGSILDYKSGFTEGTIGFSTQVAAYNAIALDREPLHPLLPFWRKQKIAVDFGDDIARRDGVDAQQWRCGRPVEQAGPGQHQRTHLQHHADRGSTELQQPDHRCDR